MRASRQDFSAHSTAYPATLGELPPATAKKCIRISYPLDSHLPQFRLIHRGTPAADAALTLSFTTIRHRAKKPRNLEVASEACMQAFGTSPSRKRLEDKPLETPQFSAGF